jgi:hypothetical protein
MVLCIGFSQCLCHTDWVSQAGRLCRNQNRRPFVQTARRG